MLDPKRLAQLIQGRLGNTSTEQENAELDAWGNESPANRQFLDRQLRPEIINGRLKAYWEIDEDRMDKKFRQAIGQGQTQSIDPAPARGSTLIKIGTYAIAAIFIGVLLIKGIDIYTSKRSTAAASRPAETNQFVNTVSDRKVGVPTWSVAQATPYVFDNTKPEEDAGEYGNLKFQKTDLRHLTIGWIDKPVLGSNRADSVYGILSIPMGIDSFQLSLPDGSRTLLRPGSSVGVVLYPYDTSITQRSLALEGSAVFQPAHNPAVPFRISTNKWDMIARGTLFAVRDYKGEDSATASLYRDSLLIIGNDHSLTLTAGQKATTRLGHKAISLSTGITQMAEIPWQDDLFDFSHERLPASMKRIAKWYHLSDSITYLGTLDTVSTGTFRSGVVGKDLTLSKFIQVVKKPNVELDVENKHLIVTGK